MMRRSLWRRTSDANETGTVEEAPAEFIECTHPMKVVTIASDLENPFLQRLLLPSCASVGIEPVVLHAKLTGRPLLPADKRAVLTRYLSSGLDRDELIVFTDAYDVVFVRGEKHIVEAYDGFAQPVVFSAEVNSWPLGVVGLALRPDPPVGPFPYLNSGGFIGPAGLLLDLCVRYPQAPSARFEALERLRAHGLQPEVRYGWSDQYHWTLVQLLEPDTIGLDHDARLFHSYSPHLPYLEIADAVYEAKEFTEGGTGSAVYQRERPRLEALLAVPNQAAQLHFPSAIGKAVALDLLNEGCLPDWLSEVLDAPARLDDVQVYPI